jgi:hypothetical protein
VTVEPRAAARRRRTAAALAAAALALLTICAPGTAAAAPAPAEQYVKYYVVRDAFEGRPETLPLIASRLLGAAERAIEIQNLNAGRRQADGGALGPDQVIRTGWSLILPWDAAGAGVRYGMLPAVDAPAVNPPSRTGSDWAHERIAADRAWERTRGDGILVAVVDSGVDATVPQLAGRVTAGADIVAGTGRGDVDRLGSGTAMAGIVGARAAPGGPVAEGVAPEATIMPVRVVTDPPNAAPKGTATGIGVAVAAGAKVVALGSYVDVADPVVAAAIEATRPHDVVFVAAAPTGAGAAGGTVRDLGGILWVAGVGPDGQPAADYRPGTVDVLAPGIDVATLAPGTGGARASSGSQYAVAFAAGVAALVRSAYPALPADQVVRRLRATADRTTAQVPDPATGYGMVNPGAAVNMLLVGERPSHASPRPAGSGRGAVILLALLVAAAMAVSGAVAWRSLQRRIPPPARPPSRALPPSSAVPLKSTFTAEAAASALRTDRD